MDDIIDDLVAAGYFRARISTLSDFDKIIGGMAWAMQAFSYDVNIDVFYTDSLDLGQKIALTERLVMVLLAMKCPYRVEPHQIVGLDYANLVPVVRWLIKRSEEVRRKQEAFNRLLALRHYHRVTKTTPDRSKWCHVVPVRHLHRLKQRPPDANESIKPISNQEDITASLLRQINENFKDNQQVSFVQLPTLMRVGNTEAVRSSLSSQVGGGGDSPEEHQDEQEEEEDVVEPADQAERAIARVAESPEVTEAAGGDEQMSEEERRLHQELDCELLATNQKILNLLKKVDSMPSQLEICQYQRRYIELHQQLISKNKDVKKLFDLYNTLDVTKHYLVKEITLLDSISSSFDLTNDSLSNRDLFLKQFTEIIRKITDIRQDMQARLERLRQKCDLLNGEYADLLDHSHEDKVIS